MSKILREYIRKIIVESYQSHTHEPTLGDPVVNINTNCKHYGSQGVVQSIDTLPDDAGKVIIYHVTNDGAEYAIGDVLEKTLDQLAPLDDLHEINEAYGSIGDGDPAQEIMQWAEDGNRVTVAGKNIWAGLGNRSGLHSYADTVIKEKWWKSGERFMKKVDQLPAGTEVELKRFKNSNRDRGKWVTAGVVTTTGPVQGAGQAATTPPAKRMREIFQELSMIRDNDIGRKDIKSIAEYTGEDAPFHGKNWEVTIGIDRYIHAGSDIGEYAEFDPHGSGSWEVYSIY